MYLPSAILLATTIIVTWVLFQGERVLPESVPVVDEVAHVMLEHPEVTKVQIQGHTNFRGSDAKNIRLSERRAEIVRDMLVERGVQPERLVTAGFGETQPINDNNGPEWRTNDRVEFVVLEKLGALE